MRRIKRFIDEHLDLTAFLSLVVLVPLVRVALESTENLTMALLSGTALVTFISLVTRRGADA